MLVNHQDGGACEVPRFSARGTVRNSFGGNGDEKVWVGKPCLSCTLTMGKPWENYGNFHYKMANYGKTHYKWQFSIAMLVITRGYLSFQTDTTWIDSSGPFAWRSKRISGRRSKLWEEVLPLAPKSLNDSLFMLFNIIPDPFHPPNPKKMPGRFTGNHPKIPWCLLFFPWFPVGRRPRLEILISLRMPRQGVPLRIHGVELSSDFMGKVGKGMSWLSTIYS